MEDPRRLLAILLALTSVACSDDEPPPTATCASYEGVSGSPSFAADVMPIFQLSCTFSSCHSSMSASPAEGLALGPPNATTPDQAAIDAVHAGIVNADSSQANEKLVVPGSPEESFLMAKLEYGDDATFAACGIDCTSCGELMPQGNSTPIDQARRDTIAAWIKNGAPND